MSLHYGDDTITLYQGDALTVLLGMADESVDCIVSSPPYYGLRDYGVDGQYGLEASPTEYVETMRAVFTEARRVLSADGTLWLNIGDSYSSNQGKQSTWRVGEYLTSGRGKVAPARNRNGTSGDLAPKNLLGIPWRVAFALQDDGWTLRNAIVWRKPNAMPESVTDRLSNRYEPVFLFSKAPRYWFDLDAIRAEYAPDTAARYAAGYKAKPKTLAAQLGGGTSMQTMFNGDNFGENPLGRNPGDVWDIPTQPFSAAHFACMPVALADRCIKAGCKPGGTVLDPFSGSGTTGLAATKLGRRYVGIDLNAEYLDLSLRTRLAQTALLDGEAS